jgi:hypothetical protein
VEQTVWRTLAASRNSELLLAGLRSGRGLADPEAEYRVTVHPTRNFHPRMIILFRIWGVHGTDYEEYRLLGCGAVCDLVRTDVSAERVAFIFRVEQHRRRNLLRSVQWRSVPARLLLPRPVERSSCRHGIKSIPPTLVILPTFTPLCFASPTFNTGISVRVCVEGEKVCRQDTSMQNYCLLGQRRRHDNKLDWHDPAVVDAHPFRYTESIASAASALNCAETALC